MIIVARSNNVFIVERKNKIVLKVVHIHCQDMRHRRFDVKGVLVFTSLPRIPQTKLLPMSDGHVLNIDSHIATLEEALDALKRERYSRDYSSLNTHTKSEERDEDKERALMSENELLLRVLRKVLLEKEFHFPFEEDENEDEEGENNDNDHAIGSFSPSKFLLQNQDGAIGTMRKNFRTNSATKRTKSRKVNTDEYSSSRRENEKDESTNNNRGEETTLSRKDVEVLERLLAKKVRINEEEEGAEEARERRRAAGGASMIVVVFGHEERRRRRRRRRSDGYFE